MELCRGQRLDASPLFLDVTLYCMLNEAALISWATHAPTHIHLNTEKWGDTSQIFSVHWFHRQRIHPHTYIYMQRNGGGCFTNIYSAWFLWATYTPTYTYLCTEKWGDASQIFSVHWFHGPRIHTNIHKFIRREMRGFFRNLYSHYNEMYTWKIWNISARNSKLLNEYFLNSQNHQR